MKAYWGVDVQIHSFFDPSTSWNCVVSFTPQGKSPWQPMDKRLGWLQTCSGRDGEWNNSQFPPGIEP